MQIHSNRKSPKSALRCKYYSEKFPHIFFSFRRRKNGASGVFREKPWRFFQKPWRFSEKPWRFFWKAWRFFPESRRKKSQSIRKDKKAWHSAPSFLTFWFFLVRFNIFTAVFYLFKHWNTRVIAGRNAVGEFRAILRGRFVI